MLWRRAVAPAPLLNTTHLPVHSPFNIFSRPVYPGQCMAGGNFIWTVPLISVQILGLVMENPCNQ